MRSLWWSMLCIVIVGVVNPTLVFSKDAAADSDPQGASDSNSDAREEEKMLQDLIEKHGIKFDGLWKNPELVAYARKLGDQVYTLSHLEALRYYEALYKEMAAKEELACLADDVLLLKAWLLLVLERPGEAQEAFQAVVGKYPEGTIDCHPGMFMAAAIVGNERWCLRRTYYLLCHPNRSSEAARLGLAQCAIALGDYEKAEGILAGLVPAGEDRPPSEDPLVRTPPPEGYLAFWNDLGFQRLLERRVDKIALLFLARCKVARGKEDEARDLYEKMLTLFPASALDASYELELLKAGKSDLIKEKLSRTAKDFRMYGLQSLCRVMLGDKVEEILKLPEQAERIEAAKAYYATLHDWLRKSDDSYRKADKIRSQEATPIE